LDQKLTSGRAAACPDVFVWALAAMALALAGCEAAGDGATIQLDTAEVQLERGTVLHEIVIRGGGSLDSIAPLHVQAEPGDAVRFTSEDHRTHAMAFHADRLTGPVRDYLERTDQLRGPPLVNRGAAWVVVLEGAPPGRYPFFCRTHDAHGLLIVGPDG
jgi:plastocyanin